MSKPEEPACKGNLVFLHTVIAATLQRVSETDELACKGNLISFVMAAVSCREKLGSKSEEPACKGSLAFFGDPCRSLL